MEMQISAAQADVPRQTELSQASTRLWKRDYTVSVFGLDLLAQGETSSLFCCGLWIKAQLILCLEVHLYKSYTAKFKGPC